MYIYVNKNKLTKNNYLLFQTYRPIIVCNQVSKRWRNIQTEKIIQRHYKSAAWGETSLKCHCWEYKFDAKEALSNMSSTNLFYRQKYCCKYWYYWQFCSDILTRVWYSLYLSVCAVYHDWLFYRRLLIIVSQQVALVMIYWSKSLRWRHNELDGVSDHQPHGCLLNRLFRRWSKKTSKLRVTGLCVGNSPGPVNSPHKGPVTRNMLPFDDVIMILWIINMLYHWSLQTYTPESMHR